MDPAIQSRLDAIKRRYVTSLADRLDELCASVEEARLNNGSGAEALDRARAIAHRLNGTAGTMGLTRIGREAEAIEFLASDLLHERGNDQTWDRLTRAMEALMMAAQDAEADLGSP